MQNIVLFYFNLDNIIQIQIVFKSNIHRMSSSTKMSFSSKLGKGFNEYLVIIAKQYF